MINIVTDVNVPLEKSKYNICMGFLVTHTK